VDAGTAVRSRSNDATTNYRRAGCFAFVPVQCSPGRWYVYWSTPVTRAWTAGSLTIIYQSTAAWKHAAVPLVNLKTSKIGAVINRLFKLWILHAWTKQLVVLLPNYTVGHKRTTSRFYVYDNFHSCRPVFAARLQPSAAIGVVRCLSGWVSVTRVVRSRVVSKRLKIRPLLLWNANRKPYPIQAFDWYRFLWPWAKLSYISRFQR